MADIPNRIDKILGRTLGKSFFIFVLMTCLISQTHFTRTTKFYHHFKNTTPGAGLEFTPPVWEDESHTNVGLE